MRTSKDPHTERPKPSTYFYPQPTVTHSSSASEQLDGLTRVEKSSAIHNNNRPKTNNDGANKNRNQFQKLNNAKNDDTPQIGVTIVEKSPITVEEDEATFSSYPSSDEDENENEVITFWVDDPNDIPGIVNAGSFFDDSPAALLEKFSRSDNPSLRHYQQGDIVQDQKPPEIDSFSTSQGHQRAPFSSSSSQDIEKEGKTVTSLSYPEYETSHSHNSYHTSSPNSHDSSLTKNTKSQSSDYSSSDDAIDINDNINPHEFHGGLIDEPSYQLELQSEGRTNEALDYPDIDKQYEFHGGFVPSRRGGRYENEIIKFNDDQDRNKRKSQLYFSDVYPQDNTLHGQDEEVEEVEDDFLEEGEYVSTGEADAAFEEESNSHQSLFSPDAPYSVYEEVEETEEIPPSYQETEEEDIEYVKENEEDEEIVEEPASEPPKKATRYKSTSSVNQYKSTSSINKYKSKFEIKDSDRGKKPKESTSEVPTIYIKYSETVPKSENSQEENSYTQNDAKEEDESSYPGSSANSVFHSGEGFGGKFVTPQNFQIPQEFRTFLSKPPSWINMENW